MLNKSSIRNKRLKSKTKTTTKIIKSNLHTNHKPQRLSSTLHRSNIQSTPLLFQNQLSTLKLPNLTNTTVLTSFKRFSTAQSPPTTTSTTKKPHGYSNVVNNQQPNVTQMDKSIKNNKNDKNTKNIDDLSPEELERQLSKSAPKITSFMKDIDASQARFEAKSQELETKAKKFNPFGKIVDLYKKYGLLSIATLAGVYAVGFAGFCIIPPMIPGYDASAAFQMILEKGFIPERVQNTATDILDTYPSIGNEIRGRPEFWTNVLAGYCLNEVVGPLRIGLVLWITKTIGDKRHNEKLAKEGNGVDAVNGQQKDL